MSSDDAKPLTDEDDLDAIKARCEAALADALAEIDRLRDALRRLLPRPRAALPRDGPLDRDPRERPVLSCGAGFFGGRVRQLDN